MNIDATARGTVVVRAVEVSLCVGMLGGVLLGLAAFAFVPLAVAVLACVLLVGSVLSVFVILYRDARQGGDGRARSRARAQAGDVIPVRAAASVIHRTALNAVLL